MIYDENLSFVQFIFSFMSTHSRYSIFLHDSNIQFHQCRKIKPVIKRKHFSNFISTKKNKLLLMRFMSNETQ